jgi:simple sugar transport system permease protein
MVSTASLAADIGIVAVGVTLLMIGGHFDLSVGSVLGLSSFIGVYLVTDLGLPAPVAVIGTLAVASFLGLINGLIVVYTRLHSFIVTLAMMLIARGILVWASGGLPQRLYLPESFANIISGRGLLGFRMSLLWFLIFAAGATFLLLRTRFGNWTMAIGNNEEAARTLGVPLTRTTLILFVISAFGAGLSGLIQAVRFDSVDAARGDGLELVAIAAVVIGGTALTGGFGSVVGTVIGSTVFGMIQVGLLLSGVPGHWFRTAVGVLLVAAVFLNRRLVQTMLTSGKARGPSPETTQANGIGARLGMGARRGR